MVLETRAAEVFKCLRGLVCVYKPADIKVEQVRHTILTKLSSGRYLISNCIQLHLPKAKINKMSTVIYILYEH